ncbi:hypothetical protein DENSPDRAFT_837706 [Dentipellis sp. KUC8613]|nr:hypothetical protein DENSPDRAFT_837706 [Dentipellis sp. KUC8613]
MTSGIPCTPSHLSISQCICCCIIFLFVLSLCFTYIEATHESVTGVQYDIVTDLSVKYEAVQGGLSRRCQKKRRPPADHR